MSGERWEIDVDWNAGIIYVAGCRIGRYFFNSDLGLERTTEGRDFESGV